MHQIEYKITGTIPLLMNNPRGVDPFDYYTKKKKLITAKRAKTDDDQLELRRLDVESKTYFDDDLKIYIPSTWISAAIAGRSFKHEAAIAKLFSTEAAVTNAREATQIFGGYGFMNEYPVARFWRDSKVLEIGEGTSEVQRMLIARHLGVGN